MAPRVSRRARALDSDDEESRPNTPSSTAPNDSKRQRQRYENSTDDDDDDEVPSDASAIQHTTLRSLHRQTGLNGVRHDPSGMQSCHQPGAIVRVKLINFVTYTSAEFFPGPNLNMVIGPNGTGKSTLVCAICLGLGWPPSVCAIASSYLKLGSHLTVPGTRQRSGRIHQAWKSRSIYRD